MDTSPSKPAVVFSKAGQRSMGVRPQKPAQIHADAKRVAVELQRNAAAKVELKIQVADGFVINTGVEAVVTHEIRGARGNAGRGEALAVCGRAAGTASGGTAAENAADDRLVSPGCDVVDRGRETELARVVFNAAGKLGVVTEGDEGAMKKFCFHDGVADPGVNERREISEGVVEMVRHIPSCMTGAEALLRVAGGSGKMQGRTEVQRRVRIIQPEVREESTHANAGDCAGIVSLDGSWCAHKIKRHARIHAKMAGKHSVHQRTPHRGNTHRCRAFLQ